MNNESTGVKLIIGVVGFVFLLQLATGLAASLACAIGWGLYYAVTIVALAAAGIAAVVVPVLACAWIHDLLRGTRYAERWLLMVTNSGRMLTGRRPVHPVPAWLREMQRPTVTVVEEAPEPARAPEPHEVRRIGRPSRDLLP